MRFRSGTIAGAAVCAAILAPIAAPAETKVAISIAHIATTASPTIQGTIVPLAKALEATGAADVTLYGAGSAYSNPQKFSELVGKGIVDLALTAQQFEPQQYPLNLLIGEPFLIDDNLKGTRAFMRLLKARPELAREYAPAHVLLVALATGEQIHARKAVRAADDLKGMRILITNPGGAAILRALGAQAVVLPLTVQYENLEKGVLDGVSSAFQSQITFKTIEVTPHHFEWNLVATPIHLTMNRKKYESLPPAVKAVIDAHSTVEAALKFAQVWRTGDDHARAEARRLKQEIVVISREAREALKQRFKSQTDGRIADLEKRGLPARALFDSIAKAVAEEEAKN